MGNPRLSRRKEKIEARFQQRSRDTEKLAQKAVFGNERGSCQVWLCVGLRKKKRKNTDGGTTFLQTGLSRRCSMRDTYGFLFMFPPQFTPRNTARSSLYGLCSPPTHHTTTLPQKLRLPQPSIAACTQQQLRPSSKLSPEKKKYISDNPQHHVSGEA